MCVFESASNAQASFFVLPLVFLAGAAAAAEASPPPAAAAAPAASRLLVAAADRWVTPLDTVGSGTAADTSSALLLLLLSATAAAGASDADAGGAGAGAGEGAGAGTGCLGVPLWVCYAWGEVLFKVNTNACHMSSVTHHTSHVAHAIRHMLHATATRMHLRMSMMVNPTKTTNAAVTKWKAVKGPTSTCQGCYKITLRQGMRCRMLQNYTVTSHSSHAHWTAAPARLPPALGTSPPKTAREKWKRDMVGARLKSNSVKHICRMHAHSSHLRDDATLGERRCVHLNIGGLGFGVWGLGLWFWILVSGFVFLIFGSEHHLEILERGVRHHRLYERVRIAAADGLWLIFRVG